MVDIVDDDTGHIMELTDVAESPGKQQSLDEPTVEQEQVRVVSCRS